MLFRNYTLLLVYFSRKVAEEFVLLILHCLSKLADNFINLNSFNIHAKFVYSCGDNPWPNIAVV
ncbi:Uncharacterized protein BM_BM17210 [Brugia malayi]|uniref:Uncharacterized protein n=1 Tax=Brugia malayi TaxID=6279 RepID=A0A4E9G0R7_BRUMA|nr:Uncharacterized protein BM_BM17210 [Brugia malayi]VIP00352.1 Uncharacterized protein BM_BM17210 [Brugia malayi]